MLTHPTPRPRPASGTVPRGWASLTSGGASLPRRRQFLADQRLAALYDPNAALVHSDRDEDDADSGYVGAGAGCSVDGAGRFDLTTPRALLTLSTPLPVSPRGRGRIRHQAHVPRSPSSPRGCRLPCPTGEPVRWQWGRRRS